MTLENVNDTSRSVIDDSSATIQIVTSLRIIIYDCNKFIVQWLIL
jgi:hypothetical protein